MADNITTDLMLEIGDRLGRVEKLQAKIAGELEKIHRAQATLCEVTGCEVPGA